MATFDTSPFKNAVERLTPKQRQYVALGAITACGVGAEQIERGAEPEVHVLLHRRQIDRTRRAYFLRIFGAELVHDFDCAPDDARDAGVADEHVMRLFGEHELARSRQRIERREWQREARSERD